ncbi:hypothetical protein J7J18_04735 [bacterium]|nr:hypothetical protein [bacterium]
MGIVFFATPNFEFFFQENSSNLEMWDAYFLPFSKKFLYSIYRHSIIDSAAPPPQTYCLDKINASLILNIDGSFFSLCVRRIHTIHDEKKNVFSFTIHSTYDKSLYNRLKEVTMEGVPLTDGMLRTASVKGAIVFGDERKKKEVLEMIIGVLTLFSIDEIEKNFM